MTRPTIVNIFKSIDESKKLKIFTNPEGFAFVFIKEIKEQLATHVAERIEYRLSEDFSNYTLNFNEPDNLDIAAEEPTLYYANYNNYFPEEKEFPQRELIPGTTHSLYDQIQTDSDVERRFIINRVQEDDKDGNIICYFKFPANFKIRIPKIIGNYNPDWGIVRLGEDGKTRVQLVRETKGSMNPNLLQFPNEKRKIDCAKKHFKAIGVKYRQVDDQITNYWVDE